MTNPLPKASTDLHARSRFTLSLSSIFRTIGVRHCIVRDMGGDDDALFNSILHAIYAAGFYHKSDTTLPLFEATAWRWSDTKVWVDLIYRHAQATIPSFRSTALASFDGAFEYFNVYRKTVDADGLFVGYDSKGLPAGEINGSPEMLANPEGGPDAIKMRRPVARMSVPATLYFNPLEAQATLLVNQGKINSGALVFNGDLIPGLIPAKSVRYDNFRLLWRNLSRYEVQYNFSILANGGWFEQVPKWDGETWTVEPQQMYADFDMTNYFPAPAV